MKHTMKYFHSIAAITSWLVAAVMVMGINYVKGQQVPIPDIIIPFDTGAGAAAGTYNFPGGNGFDNRTIGGVTWTLEWQSSLSPTVTFQSSLGVASPASYGAYTGTTVFSGAGIMTFSNLITGTVVDTPWVRVQVVTGSSGQTRGVLYGYRTGATGGTGGGGGGGGGTGCPNPCPVVGTAAAGSPPSGAPVQVAGSDGTDIRTVSTDTSGVVNVNVKSSVPPIGATAFTSEQQAVTGSAVNLGTNTAKSVCVKALIGNTINVYVGAVGVTTATGFELPPGLGTCVGVSNTNLLYVIASTTGASVAVEWTN